MVGCAQNRHHAFDVWEHTLRVVDGASARPAPRWAALLHDAGKPGTRSLGADGEAHFYGHETRSMEMAAALLARLKASHALRAEVAALIRHHCIHPTPEWGDGACRRFLRRLLEDGLDLDRWAAFKLADQRAKGKDLEAREREHALLVDRLAGLAAACPPLGVRDLALDGAALMALAGKSGGPWLGEMQKALLDAVLDDPAKNTPEALRDLALAQLRPTDQG